VKGGEIEVGITAGEIADGAAVARHDGTDDVDAIVVVITAADIDAEAERRGAAALVVV
jgi:hypothetical protein